MKRKKKKEGKRKKTRILSHFYNPDLPMLKPKLPMFIQFLLSYTEIILNSNSNNNNQSYKITLNLKILFLQV